MHKCSIEQAKEQHWWTMVSRRLIGCSSRHGLKAMT
jgi:hypothetical protein